MGAPPQDLEIVFEVKREMSNEKITRKEKLSNLQNAIFFLFSWTPSTFKASNFHVSCSI
jgi:hypothetical protein